MIYGRGTEQENGKKLHLPELPHLDHLHAHVLEQVHDFAGPDPLYGPPTQLVPDVGPEPRPALRPVRLADVLHDVLPIT